MDGLLPGGFSLVMQVVILAGFLALANERMIEVLVKRVMAFFPTVDHYFKPITDLAAVLTGVLISLGFGIDFVGPVVESIMGSAMPVAWAGYALSALIVGGGSNLIHDLWNKGEQPIS